eukprot:PhF_6_TR44222/c2_g1_i1/m.67941
MGGGASAELVKDHVKKMEKVVEDMQKHCDDQRRVLTNFKFGEGPEEGVAQTPSSILRRRSSFEPSSAHPPAAQHHKDSTGSKKGIDGLDPKLVVPDVQKTSGPPSARRRSSVEFTGEGHLTTSIGRDHSLSPTNNKSPRKHKSSVTDSTSAGGGPLVLSPSVSRSKLQAARKECAKIFESFKDNPISDHNSPIKCNHIGALAVALTFLLGGARDEPDRRKRVTPEDIFFSVHLPLHYIDNDSITLDELYDIAKEFMEVDNRFKDGSFDLKLIHMDVTLKAGEVSANPIQNETGDRGPKGTPNDLRKMFLEELNNPSVAFVLNYDPYVVEQSITLEDPSSEDEGGAFQAVFSPSAKKAKEQSEKASIHKANKGGFAVASDFHGVMHTVTIGSIYIDRECHFQPMDIPIQGLYKAMCLPSVYNRRSRGFLRFCNIGKQPSMSFGSIPTANDGVVDEDHQADVGCIYSPELVSGKVMGSCADGIPLTSVYNSMSPHLVAAGFAMHLIHGKRTGQYGRGVCTSDIVRTLRLPTDVVVDFDLPLLNVFAYLRDYIREKGWEFDVTCTPVLQRVDRDDAATSMSVSDLATGIDLLRENNVNPDLPNTVLLVNFNPNVAHNVLNISNQSHWAVVTGWDGEQFVRLHDAKPKKFSASWSVSVDRLHAAVVGYGFIAISRKNIDKDIPVFKFREVEDYIQQKLDAVLSVSKIRFENLLPTTYSHAHFYTPLTPLTLSLSRLGHATTVGCIVRDLTEYDLNHLLSVRMSLNDMARVLNTYSAKKKIPVRAVVNHFDTEKSRMAFHNFVVGLKDIVSKPTEESMVVYFKRELLVGAPHDGGDYAYVAGFSESEELVTVVDGNPNSFLSVWRVNQKDLFDACQSRCNVSHRGRGYIILKKEAEPTSPGRPFSIAKVPLAHPFRSATSPVIRSLSFALRELGECHSQEEIFYAAFLKALGENRRRGSVANAWREADVSLYVLNEKLTTALSERLGRRFLESQKLADFGVERLMDLDTDDALYDTELRKAVDPAATYIVLAVYDLKMVHNLKLPTMASGVGLIKHFDGTKVWVSDADPTNFPEVWSCDAALFRRACGYGTADDALGGDVGWIKIGKFASE